MAMSFNLVGETLPLLLGRLLAGRGGADPAQQRVLRRRRLQHGALRGQRRAEGLRHRRSVLGFLRVAAERHPR